ncbi:transcriptional regulator, TetR family [Frankineae bacterium MT45]|nr:transcriptional regulator, TetR family [Frankineae bacterium MT45]
MLTEKSVRKDVARNRALLLAAADEVFCLRGAHATLDEVAQHAGVGVATAYRHFENKQGLLVALFQDRINKVQQILEQAETISDPREAIESFLYGVCETQANDAGLREAMTSNIGLPDAAEVRDRLAPIARRILERARTAGLLRPEAHENDIPIILWMIGSITDYAGATNPLIWRRYLEMLLDGLFAESVPRRGLSVPALDEDAIAVAMTECGRTLR